MKLYEDKWIFTRIRHHIHIKYLISFNYSDIMGFFVNSKYKYSDNDVRLVLFLVFLAIFDYKGVMDPSHYLSIYLFKEVVC